MSEKSPEKPLIEKIENLVFPPGLSTSEQRKRTPIFSGVLQYFPDALEAVARLSWKGNEKHNPGQHLHWSRHKSDDHADCALRHLKDAGKWDPDNMESHTVPAAWRVLALLQLEEEIRKAR